MGSVRRGGSLVVGLAVLAVVVSMTAPLTACAPPKKVLVIGDSLTVGSVTAGLGSQGGADWTVSAAVGRSTRQGIAIAKQRNIAAYDLVVIALGTNDYLDSTSGYRAKVDDMMDALGPGTKVIWINVDPGTDHMAPAADGVNPAIRAAAAAYGNLTLADWAAYVRGVPGMASFRAADQIHYNSSGYRLRARWMESLVPAPQ